MMNRATLLSLVIAAAACGGPTNSDEPQPGDPCNAQQGEAYCTSDTSALVCLDASQGLEDVACDACSGAAGEASCCLDGHDWPDWTFAPSDCDSEGAETCFLTDNEPWRAACSGGTWSAIDPGQSNPCANGCFLINGAATCEPPPGFSACG